jgi:hypothetical protein
MNEAVAVVLFILWYAGALWVSENLGKQHKLGVEYSFFWCIMLTPVLGYLITRCLSPKMSGNGG